MDNVNPTVLNRQINESMSLADRIRVALQSYGTQTIRVSLSDFSAKVGAEPYLVYQTLYRFARNKEIEILHENRDGQHGSKQRNVIVGFKLLKLRPVSEILDRAISSVETKPVEVPKRVKNSLSSRIPTILEYKKKQTVLNNIKQQLRDGGFDPDAVLNLPEETRMAEEAMILFDAWDDAMSTIAGLRIKVGLLERRFGNNSDEEGASEPMRDQSMNGVADLAIAQ